MDAKKKRNKKKKGNQGKNTGDVTSNAGEAAPQCHNHESAPKDHHDGADADDAMSSVGGAPQYQNRKPTPQANYSGANADDTVSSVEEGIPCYENHEPTMTQENHKVSNKVHADQRSVGMSESSVELDMHGLYEGKLGKLHETINQLQDEKSSWLQKVSMIESELENLHNKVGYHAQNEILLEEKLNNLQNGCNVLVKKEEILDNKVRCIEDINDALTHGETYLEERLCGLEETNKALQVQVKVLDETSKNTIEENERLVKSLDELESRLQALEGKAFLTEASMTKEVPENPVMDRKDLIGSLLHKQSTGFTDMTSEGNGLIADRGLSSSVTVTSENNYSHINNSPSNAHASNYLDETSVQLLGKASSTSAAEGLIDVNAHQVSKQGFDEPRMSEEIVPVPLDDIQIHEDDPQPSEAETAEVPFSDAPIVGAPFRLISFVARYVSGADLVNQKKLAVCPSSCLRSVCSKEESLSLFYFADIVLSVSY